MEDVGGDASLGSLAAPRDRLRALQQRADHGNQRKCPVIGVFGRGRSRTRLSQESDRSSEKGLGHLEHDVGPLTLRRNSTSPTAAARTVYLSVRSRKFEPGE